MSYLKFFAVLSITMLLGACVSLSTIKTMHAMSDFNPIDSDMANLAFGIEASPLLEVQAQSSTFSMTIAIDGEEPVVHRFALVKIEPKDLQLTSVPQNRGKVLSLFQFSDAAKTKIIELQAKLRASEGKKGKGGSIGIGIEPDFCKTAPIDNARERFSAYIAKGGKGDLMPLIDNLSVKDLLKEAKLQEVRDC